MDVTYTMMGADGQQHGPAPLAQLKAWAAEGRVKTDTKIRRSDANDWRPAAEFAELGLSPAAAPRLEPHAVAENYLALERQVKSGANWFFWIAGLSLINSLAALKGANVGFLLGLGVTQLVDARFGAAGNATALAVDAVIAGVFVVLGVFARKGHTWSFITGLVLYGADEGLLLRYAGEWAGIAFHALALLCIFLGLRANLKFNPPYGGRAG